MPGSLRHLLHRSPKRVLVIGGGPTGLFCADRLRHHFEVTVVDPKAFFEFTPGVLRALADPAHHSRITFDYREVLEQHLGVEFILGEASSIDVSPPGSGPGRGCVQISTPQWSKGTPHGASPNKLHFDYCVVAVGMSNGLWKPRAPGEPAGPSWASPSSATSTSGGSTSSSSTAQPPKKLGSGPATIDERSLEARRFALRSLHERLAGARGAVVVGAGLVGIELAAELAHFFPRLKVTLVDGAGTVLPQLAEPARDYARDWLQKQGVKLKLGRAFVPELVAEGDVVLWCVGARSRSAGLFQDSSVLKPNGQIRVNRRMQVLRRVSPADSGASTSSAPLEMEPLGQGRVFAVGDAASVEGVPTAQIIFHGEEMAAIAVANIEAAEEVSSPFALSKGREAEAGQPLLCCTSLGPQDGMFSTQSELVATGALAALQKQLIEDTKMGALRGELVSSLLWMPVH